MHHAVEEKNVDYLRAKYLFEPEDKEETLPPLRLYGIIVPKEGIASEHSEQQLNGTLGKSMPVLFRASSVDDRQAQEPWGNI